MAGPGAARLLLLSVLLAISLSRGAAAPSPVYDTEGHVLSADADYYVLPAPHAPGAGAGAGGLTLAPNVYQCPLFVAQEDDPLRPGFPVRFTPLHGHGGDRTVRVSFDVAVHFAAATTCVQTTEWHVAEPFGSSGPRHVVTGPVQAPTAGGRERVFRVERHSHGYILVWCGVPTECEQLGVFRDDRDRAWLAVSEQPHVVVFQKAPSIHA
ncbi:unnamed protein product [Urochloa decumbens]|uniref:Uncharacterized protein n=1 Tax=Urochloa decumbens TaxID=240449 RepID=A0ABC9CV08_9POAL